MTEPQRAVVGEIKERMSQVDQDLARLREEFTSSGWRFSTVWTSLSRHAVQRITGHRHGVLLVASDYEEMVGKIKRETD